MYLSLPNDPEVAEGWLVELLMYVKLHFTTQDSRFNDFCRNFNLELIGTSEFTALSNNKHILDIRG